MKNDYELKYLKLLAKEFPTVQEVSTELINLTAILNIPKGTEHFLSDIHGEYDTFNHFLKNGSGVTRDKLDIIFPKLSETEKNRLAFFIYYPKQMLRKYENLMEREDYLIFIRQQLLNLVDISKYMSQKYTKSKVRKSLPKAFSYIIQELMFEKSTHTDKTQYYDAIIDAIFKTNRERNFIIEVSYFIQRLTIDRLHIVGDIFDRGPSAHLVMNKMIKYHSVDIEWGNHDILWMGAACGSKLAICNVLRSSARYNTLDTLEDGYGINLLPFARYSQKHYQNDDCTIFMPKNSTIKPDIDKEQLVAKMHKAAAILQFKLEGSVFGRNPNFKLDNRLLLHKIDYKKGTIRIEGVTYPLKDTNFPTIDPLDPYKLTDEEEDLLAQLKNAFLNNDLLQLHIEFLFQNGHMFLKYNNNLMFHGCIPLNADGSFSKIKVDRKYYSGKALFNILETKLRVSYLHRNDKKSNNNNDYFIFLWQGENSPLFGKKDMKTFERYFIEDKKSHYEEMNNYFSLREDRTILKNIYQEFKIDYNKSKIINGHVPNDISAGDRPILGNGRIYAIDGGMSKQYASKIKIGGYTLVIDSYKIFLISHERFTTLDEIIENEKDIISLNQSEEVNINREYVYDTDKGITLQEEINDLYKLLDAYRDGAIKEYFNTKKSHFRK
ncbi:MAG: fructose-1,6-bisphosphatase [Candidatus Izimaplasma sp.]|nr:fructose-1,6-bisphosphatase [Candidatus Izimaplasma bacterium]